MQIRVEIGWDGKEQFAVINESDWVVIARCATREEAESVIAAGCTTRKEAWAYLYNMI